MAHQWNQELSGSGDYESRLAAWLARSSLTPEELKRARTWLLVTAVLALITGLVSIAVPIITSLTMTIFIGWVLVAAGIAIAVQAVSHRAPLRGLEALLSLLAGLYLLAFPLSGTVTLTFILAVWFFATGIVSLGAAFQQGGAGERGLAVFGGVVGVVLGLLIALELPSSAAWAIGLLVGINLIFWSARAFMIARLLKERTHSA